MGKWPKSRVDPGHLLGRALSNYGDGQGRVCRGRASEPEAEGRGKSVRGAGQMGRGQPRSPPGHRPVQGGLWTSLSRWTSPLQKVEEVVTRPTSPMDGESPRSGRTGSRKRRTGSFEKESKGDGSKGKDKGSQGGQELIFVREGKEKEKEVEEEEEESKAEDCRDQGTGRPLQPDLFGPGCRRSKENSKKGKKVRIKEKQKGFRERFQLRGERLREPKFRGRRVHAFWRGGQSKEAMEEVPWSAHVECRGDDAGDGSSTHWPTMGGRPRSGPSDMLCLLEAGHARQDEWSIGKRGTDPLLHDRLATARESSELLRCGASAPQGTGRHSAGQPLFSDPTTGACTLGQRSHDEPCRDHGGQQIDARGEQGQFVSSKALGESTMGQASGGEQRRQGKEQGQGKRTRKEGTTWTGLGKQGREEEVKGTSEEAEGWELESSEKRCGRESGYSVVAENREQKSSGQVSGLGSGIADGRGSDLKSSISPFHFELLGRQFDLPPGLPPSEAFSFLLEKPDGLNGLSDEQLVKFSLKGQTLSGMAGCFHAMLGRLMKFEPQPHGKIQSSGGVFPLPDTFNGLLEATGPMDPSEGVALLMICRALNSYYGASSEPRPVPTKAQKGALEALRAYSLDVTEWQEKFEGVRWEQFMAVKGVDYKGDEVRLARYFRWENLSPALPEGIGSIPLVEICDLGTLDYVNHFERYLIPEDERVYTKPPRIMVEDSDWERVCAGLLEKGLCRLISKDEVYHLGGRPLFNGLFGVSKDEFADGVEVFRLIMNLVPVNKLCRNLHGDVATLPSWAGMQSYLLEDGDLLMMSSEDIRCFFYLFEIPKSWHAFMSFGKEVPQSLLPQGSSGVFYLASRVLPMGFLNSVTIAQHVHRRIARLSLHALQPKTGPQAELRKDRPMTSCKWSYRVYLDNFDALERVDRQLALSIRGEVSPEVEALRLGYEAWGLPRHPKKAVSQATEAEIQGALVDGVKGRVRPRPVKVLKYVELAWQLLQEGQANQKQLQVVCGGFVYCCMFRRALLGLLNRVWVFITELSKEPPVVKRPIPKLVQLELMRFICALPLAQMNLRLPMLGPITASDASEYGGGFCISDGLTPLGSHAASCPVRGDLPEPDDYIQVLTIGLFDGIGALRVASDVLRLPMAGHVSSEVSKEGNRVLESHFPDSLQVGPVQEIDDSMVQQWAARFCNVGVVLVGGGPPCQGVSGLNSDRKGALRDERSNLFVHVKRVYQLVKTYFRWAQVHYFMESVFSMDAADRATMSQHMGVCPYMVDGGDISLCRRPRLYWFSWELKSDSDFTVAWFGKDHEAYGMVKLDADVDPSKFLSPGWSLNGTQVLPTFTTSRPRESPGNRPAGLWQCEAWEVDRWKRDKHRYPPYVYRDQHLLIHADGTLRLPSISEKEVIMGFPLGYTTPCLPKGQQHGESYLDVRSTLIGNSWHVPAVAWLLSHLFHPLGLTSVSSLKDVLEASSPGNDQSLQGFLRRLPMQRVPRQEISTAEEQLARKLSTFVSVKGEDLMIQAPTENVVKFHRLRTSVPAKLWKWRTVCGWPWARDGYHINGLELQAVQTCLEWRVGRKRHQRCRFLHLTDSLVTLHSLTRGRSSSRKLRPVLSRINALLLATDVHPIWVYVSTKQNPADRPSRRPVVKQCLKGKHK